jgi:hypothetical protein
MNIISDRPVVYSNVGGKGKEKFKSIFNKGLDLVKGVGKEKGKEAAQKYGIPTDQVVQTTVPTSAEQPKKGLSTMAWVGIGAGALAVVGLGIYFVKRK